MTIGALSRAVAHHLVEEQSRLVALAESEPADPRRQALERDPLAGPAEPVLQPRVVGEELEQRLVGGGDVGRIARERHPAERSASFAERVADERRNESRIVERLREAAELRLRAEVVAVVEGDGAAALQLEDRLDMPHHRVARALEIFVGLLGAQFVDVFVGLAPAGCSPTSDRARTSGR